MHAIEKIIRAAYATALLFTTACMLFEHDARAGIITSENAKAGTPNWLITKPGNAEMDGAIDVYPSQWSISPGQKLGLRVRARSDYSLHVLRLGYYGGAFAREVATLSGGPDPQPYPTPDAARGLAAAGWHDSLTLSTDGGWVPGLYVARVDESDGLQAATFFVVRDDGYSPKMPILLVICTNTHMAYDAWPGMERGGKSLYGFNSSAPMPSESSSNQAVAVSYDRPLLTNGGLGDIVGDEGSFTRYVERVGWDVAYATDQDLHANPSIVKGRRVVALAGHWEYVTRPEFQAFEAARDAGTNLLLMSGDTISWQVRFEDGGKTLVGYKESWDLDPENKAGVAAASAGDLTGARAHFANVTRGWKNVGFVPSYSLDDRHPGMLLTGVSSAGAMGPNGPWGDLRVDAADHWLFAGTGFSNGDLLPKVFGYEYDSLWEGDPDWAAFVPKGRIKLGTILHRTSRAEVGGAAYIKADSGAEIVSLGAINFAYALDDWASPWKAADHRAQVMVDNALRRWTAGAPQPAPITVSIPPGSESTNDAGVEAGAEAGVDPPTAVTTPSAPPPGGDSRGGCAYGAASAPAAAVAMFAALAVAVRRKRKS